MNPFDSSYTTNPFAPAWGPSPVAFNPNPFASVPTRDNFDVTGGLPNSDDNETFSVSLVRYTPPAPIRYLVTNNNILVLALDNGRIIKLNLLDLPDMEGKANICFGFTCSLTFPLVVLFVHPLHNFDSQVHNFF